MSKLATELQSLSPSAVVELFELDLTPNEVGSSNKYYFHGGTNKINGNVIWQGQTYIAFPISVSGYEQSITGALPRLRLKASNVTGLLTTLILQYNDMLGAKLTRKRTFAKYLDAANFPGGVNPDADSSVHLPDDIFYAERKVSENREFVDMEFATRFDVEGVMLPRRQVTWNVCGWHYRGSGCRYAGAVKTDSSGATIVVTPTDTYPFAQWNNSTAYTVGQCRWYLNEQKVFICIQANTGQLPTNPLYWTEDVCLKKLTDCTTRWGTTASLPFGAFPGVARIPQG